MAEDDRRRPNLSLNAPARGVKLACERCGSATADETASIRPHSQPSRLLAVAGSGKLGLKLAPCLSVIGEVGRRRTVLGEPVKGNQPAQQGLHLLERHHIGPVGRRAIGVLMSLDENARDPDRNCGAGQYRDEFALAAR